MPGISLALGIWTEQSNCESDTSVGSVHMQFNLILTTGVQSMCYILIINMNLQRLWYLPTVSSSRSAGLNPDMSNFKVHVVGLTSHASLLDRPHT